MTRTRLIRRIGAHLDRLCNRITDRSTGSPGNRAATTYVQKTLESMGWQVECPAFRCMDWVGGRVRLKAGTAAFRAYAGPYSLPFDGEAPLTQATRLSDLRRKALAGKIVLIHGGLAREPLFPKGFVFYNPARHQQIIRRLEEKRPVAIIAATGRRPDLVGALYPFPMFEDGDFDIPSVYVKDTTGVKLLGHVGRPVRLAFTTRRIPARGHNVIATKRGSCPQRVVLTAHVDARKGTPGALDDASGVATLLAVGELLREYAGQLTVEIAILNGEDYYAASGQMNYWAANQGRWSDIRMAVNLDDVGYRVGKTAYSFYECPGPLRFFWERRLSEHRGLVPGKPWVQGDHSLFVMNGVPAVAFTSDRDDHLMKSVIHTARDRVEQVNPAALVELAVAVMECVTATGDAV